MKCKLIVFTLLLVLTACQSGAKKSNKQNEHQKELSAVRYAKYFSINHNKEYTEITVRNPWDTTRILEKYILVNRDVSLPEHLPEGTLVRTPVKRVAICSAVHAGMWKMVGEINRVVAVCEPKYINLPEVKTGIANGKIIDLGMESAINYEKLLACKPELLVVSPFETSTLERYKNAGIAVGQDVSYMEESPLGRSEWIKFEAAFCGQDSLANEIFKGIEKRYLDLCEKVNKTTTRPTVFTEKKFGDAWYISSGNSYAGRFLRDAGANYIWSDLKNSNAVPIPFEKVYEKAVNAEFWLIKYNNPQSDLSYEALKQEYELYANFRAFKEKNIFSLNSAKVPFYEQGPMEPDLVLADFVYIFHPELLPGFKPKYYFKVK